jgi:hypothetical protein
VTSFRHLHLAAAFTALVVMPSALAQIVTGPGIQLSLEATGPTRHLIMSIRSGAQWLPALAADHPLYLRTAAGMEPCAITAAKPVPGGLTVYGTCSVGTFEQHFTFGDDPDVLDVSTLFTPQPNADILSVEDRFDFVPARHPKVDNYTGPLDFVWSQNIKSQASDLLPTNSFKSPAIILQQGTIFAALLPRLNERHAELRAMDLDITSGPRPWISFGQIPSEPHDHSYFRRAPQTNLETTAGNIAYQYSLLLSTQPPRLGYRRVVRRLWQQTGHPEFQHSATEQQSVIHPEIRSFDSWRTEAWHTTADDLYRSFPCGTTTCGSLQNKRSIDGDWGNNRTPDAWFNAWFESLRSAYGWYIYGRDTHDPNITRKAESILNTALSSPQHDGAFPTIYLIDQHQWVPSDGWAGYEDSYHTYSMSWTAYWMLRWAQDLTPARRTEVLAFVKAYGDFLLAHQHPDGVISSWFNAKTLEPRPELRDFNAETAPSALLLVTLGNATGDHRYTAAAERGMAFIEREVRPRQRWFDFETFRSCARKPFDFFDPWTAQFPQNNLAEIQAVQAMLALYQATGKKVYLDHGTDMLDYLLLTQQVWNNPQFTPQLLGGFTTQNTDQEWSDARDSLAAPLLADYYRATGRVEYLERSVSAVHAALAVAPWENWAHTGYVDQPGALSSFDWGTGSAVASIEMMQPFLADAFIDLAEQQGIGFDESNLTNVQTSGDSNISFTLASPAPGRPVHIRFGGVESARTYTIQATGHPAQIVSGKDLARDGFILQPTP